MKHRLRTRPRGRPAITATMLITAAAFIGLLLMMPAATTGTTTPEHSATASQIIEPDGFGLAAACTETRTAVPATDSEKSMAVTRNATAAFIEKTADDIGSSEAAVATAFYNAAAFELTKIDATATQRIELTAAKTAKKMTLTDATAPANEKTWAVAVKKNDAMDITAMKRHAGFERERADYKTVAAGFPNPILA